MIPVTHANFTGKEIHSSGRNVKADDAKNTNEENKLHHNGGATGPCQSVGEESQHQLKCTPLLQEGPAV